jgi:hypothetical protein
MYSLTSKVDTDTKDKTLLESKSTRLLLYYSSLIIAILSHYFHYSTPKLALTEVALRMVNLLIEFLARVNKR